LHSTSKKKISGAFTTTNYSSRPQQLREVLLKLKEINQPSTKRKSEETFSATHGQQTDVMQLEERKKIQQ
jgi:hypothetical protein